MATGDVDSSLFDLIYRVKALVDQDRVIRRRFGLEHNIFRVLDRSTDEVKCHSAFLAELLDSAGKHGQGSMFFELFLDVLAESEAVTWEEQNKLAAMSWSVQVESSFIDPENPDVYGRIDILLSSATHAIVIENKIYAADQEKQLWRYDQYLRSRWPGGYMLFYLNLDGEEPSESSLCGLTARKRDAETARSATQNLQKDDVRLISYDVEIGKWLDRCIGRAALLPHIRENLMQYRALVRELTGKGATEALIMDIIATVMERPALVDAVLDLASSADAIKEEIQRLFWKELHEKLKSVFGIDRVDNDPSAMVAGYYGRGGNRRFGISLRAGRDLEGCKLVLRILVDWRLYFMWQLADARDGTFRNPATEHELLHKALNVPDTVQSEKDELWAYIMDGNDDLNFYKFNAPCRTLADKSSRTRLVERIAADAKMILEDIDKAPAPAKGN